MEHRKLNLNAPLISVRRSLTALGGGKVKKVENSHRKQHSRSSSKADSLLDQVTEPGAVPFRWEQIPGTAKDGRAPNRQAHRNVRVPPGSNSSVVRQELEREDQDANLRRPNRAVIEANSANDRAIDHSKDGLNENKEDENEDDDIYSDALEILSATDSISMNCSANGLSTLDGFTAKPAGTFSVDPQTRDFMMSRFLPAAKAMALEPAHQASRKQLMPLDRLKPINTVAQDRGHPVCRQKSPNVPQQDQDTEEEESEESDDEYDENSGRISIKGCGLIPRLCAKNSLCILNPIPGIRTRRMPSSNDVEKPSKAAYSRSRSSSPTTKKHSKDDKRKAYSGILSPRLLQVENRLLSCGSNRFANTSERQSVSRSSSPLARSGWTSPFRRSRCTSPNRCEPTQSINPMSRTSSPLRRLGGLSPSRRSGCLSPNRNEPTQFTGSMSRSSSPLRRAGGTSPFRRSGCISPHGNEPARSPFQVGGSLTLGLRREAENSNTNKLSLYNGSNTRSQELIPLGDNKMGSGSSRYAAEKTLYVDTVNRMTKLSRTILQVTGGRTSARNDSKSLLKSGEMEETTSTESSFQDAGSSNTNEEEKDMENRDSTKVSNQDSKALVCMNTSMTQNVSTETRQEEKQDDSQNANTSLVPCHPLAPHLPEKPSESWLWRTISSRNLSSKLYSGGSFQSKRQDCATVSGNTKWETIVKSSYLHHDRARYSEELVPHRSQQSKR